MIAGSIDHARVAGMLHPEVVGQVVRRLRSHGRHPFLLEFLCEYSAPGR